MLDITGRAVASWQLQAGDATTTWNVGSAVVPGAYLLRVETDGRTDPHPFTVVR